jgi:hypothetical protein
MERLAAATASLGPTRGFEDRVLAAIGPPRTPSWDQSVVRFGRVMLAVAALSAVTGAIFGFRSLSAETEESAIAYGMEELDW